MSDNPNNAVPPPAKRVIPATTAIHPPYGKVTTPTAIAVTPVITKPIPFAIFPQFHVNGLYHACPLGSTYIIGLLAQ